jgi:hypothetical protein
MQFVSSADSDMQHDILRVAAVFLDPEHENLNLVPIMNS